MNIQELQEKYKQQAIALGLCEKWQSEWGNPDKDGLCQKFVKGIDFGIKHDWPSLNEIKEDFTDNELNRNGVFVQGENRTTGINQVVCMGDSKVIVEVPEYTAYRIFARHNSHVEIVMHNNSHVYVSLFDNCSVEVIMKEDKARLCASHFGGKIINPEYFDRINKK